MTEYTADDFKNASFARLAGGCIAMRHGPYWVDSDDADFDHMLTHGDMAKSGWVPVQESRPLTADDITDEMIERARWFNEHLSPETVRKMLTAALTEPTSPEEKVEVVLRRYWSGDINGTDLAALIVEEMNR